MYREAVDAAHKANSVSTWKEVNRVLYRLEKDQLVEKQHEANKKPVWRLCKKAAAMGDDLFRDTSQDITAPGAYSPEKRNKVSKVALELSVIIHLIMCVHIALMILSLLDLPVKVQNFSSNYLQ